MADLIEATDIVEIKNPSTLKMKFNYGMSENGKIITKTRSYSHLKPTSKGVDVFNVAQALESLQQHSVLEVIKQDNTSLNS